MNRTFQLLQQEAWLVESQLAQGLTLLRQSSYSRKGSLYTASMQLCIGIERMLKLIIVVEWMTTHELQAPPGNMIKKYGHDLRRLFARVSEISRAQKDNPLESAMCDELNQAIMRVIGEFAAGDVRYFNLQALAELASERDPLVHWKDVLDQVIVQDVSQRIRRRAKFRGEHLGAAVARLSDVMISDLTGEYLSAQSLVERQDLENEAARYLTHRVLVILDSLRQILVELSHTGWQAEQTRQPVVPYMSEFFKFICADRSITLRKRRWP